MLSEFFAHGSFEIFRNRDLVTSEVGDVFLYDRRNKCPSIGFRILKVEEMLFKDYKKGIGHFRCDLMVRAGASVAVRCGPVQQVLRLQLDCDIYQSFGTWGLPLE